MEMNEIVEALGGKDVDVGVIAAIEELASSAEVERLLKELSDEQGKTAGILADKKKFKDRAEKAEAGIKTIEDGKLPAEERHARELKDMQDRLEQERADREAQASDFAKTQRDAGLADITGSIKWADGTPHSTAKLIIRSALIDVEDLSDKTKVDEILNTVKESHKTFIAASAPGGSGSKAKGGGGGGSDDKPATMQDLVTDAWQK